MVTTVTGKNQVTLPADVVAELGLERGARLEWSVDKKHGRLIGKIQPSRAQALARLREIGRKTRSDGLDSAVELARWRAQDDAERESCLK